MGASCRVSGQCGRDDRDAEACRIGTYSQYCVDRSEMRGWSGLLLQHGHQSANRLSEERPILCVMSSMMAGHSLEHSTRSDPGEGSISGCLSSFARISDIISSRICRGDEGRAGECLRSEAWPESDIGRD